jgi:hypothetical protein
MEPDRPAARQSGEMTSSHRGPGPATHETHDQVLIAARVAGDLASRDLERAEELLATCASCRSLRDELVAITAASRSLPAPSRPPGLDFRLSPEQASRLAAGGWWRRLLRPFGSTTAASLRPMAAVLTTLGLAGLLLAALPNLQLGAGGAAGILSTGGASVPGGAAGGAAASSAPRVVGTAPLPTPAPTTARAEGDTAGGASPPAPSAVSGNTGELAGPATPRASSGDAYEGVVASPPGDGETAAESPGSSGPTPLMLVSLILLGAGLGIFALRLAARRPV